VSPSRSPTVAQTGHSVSLTGDISLNNIDYSSFFASEKNGAENALESLWHLDDGLVVVTATCDDHQKKINDQLWGFFVLYAMRDLFRN
jgi:hypothetical protein